MKNIRSLRTSIKTANPVLLKKIWVAEAGLGAQMPKVLFIAYPHNPSLMLAASFGEFLYAEENKAKRCGGHAAGP